MTIYTIESVPFSNVYLRMDGRGVTEFNASGGGTVNCQFSARFWEHFKINQVSNDIYTIESVAFPNVYLRMDGQGVTEFNASGGGTVNCQFSARSWEQFKIHQVSNGIYTIESVAFPNVYLRMDGQGVTEFNASGGGTVNCQFSARSWEQFRITPIFDYRFFGVWLYEGKPGPVISVSGDNVTIDMSAYNRPEATGKIVSNNKISVTFPDDATFTGELVDYDRIEWSNGTVWNR